MIEGLKRAKKVDHVHFMGIGGSALAGVAILAQNEGFKVSGCDITKDSYYLSTLKSAGIKFLVGHDSSHLKGVDILAVSPAIFDVNPDHPELLEAKKRGILMTWQEFMGKYLQKNKFVIAIAGAHGKSTTTALIGLVLGAGGLDPMVEVGAIVPKWKATVRVGQSKYFVCEADEFNYNFLNYSPSIIVINNIEMDHPEFFKDFEQFRGSFKKFVRKIKKPKVLVVNEENKGIQQLLGEMSNWLKKEKVKVIGYFLKQQFGFPFQTEYQGEIIETTPKFTRFKVITRLGKEKFELKIPGVHNVANALGVLACAFELDVKLVVVKKVFRSFGGLGRRLDLVGEKRGVKVFDDYAVHPTAVRATLQALEQKCPSQRIWAILEPHQFSRLYLFLNEFAMALSLVDKVIITKIYSGREKDTGKVRAEDLVTKIGGRAEYIKDFNKVAQKVVQKAKRGDLIIVFGAGKSYLLSKMILERL